MMSIDQMAYMNAWRHIHPAEKGIFAGSFLCFSLFIKTPASALFIFLLMSVAVTAGARVPAGYYIKMLLLPFTFLAMSVVMILFSFAPAAENTANTIVQFTFGSWQIFITESSVKQVSALLLSVMAGISCMYFLILTTPIQQIIWLMQKMKLPSLFIELFAVTYRFIFVLLHTVNQVFTAQVSRLGYSGMKRGFSSSAQLVVSVLFKSMKTAQETQRAMDSRGNSGEFYGAKIHAAANKRNWLRIALLAGLYGAVVIAAQTV